MINLDGKDLPSFVKVNSIEFSILPPITNNFLEVRGKAGAYHTSQDVGTRKITANITIVADRINGVIKATRDLAEWLYHKEPVKLVLQDEPDKYYLAVPNGDTDITEMVNIGQGAIEFICTEPFAFGEEKTQSFELNENNDIAEIEVGGTADTYPQIEITVQDNITSMAVESDNNSLIIGEPAEVTETPKNTKPLVMIDNMKSLNGWVNREIDTVDGGIIAGQFAQVGESFRVKNNNFGTSDRWHGASAVKTLPKSLKDFEVYFRIGYEDSHKKQVGRVELYLIDENDVQFGKLSLHDSFVNDNRKRFEARAGSRGGGKYFLKEYPSDWSKFYGRMILKREGRLWTVSIAPMEKGRTKEVYEESWFDSTGAWDSYELAKIQIHIGTYAKNQPAKDMFISHIEVKECLTLKDNEAPIIAIKDDVLLIDNEKMHIYLNGEPRFDLINPASNFIKFKKGINTIKVSPSNVKMNLTYPERWL